MAQMRYKAAVAMMGLSLIAAGCSDPKTDAQIDQTSDRAKQALKESYNPGPAKRYDPLVVSNGVWTGSTARRMQRGLPLPSKFETSRGVAVVSSDPMTLGAILGSVAQQTGIPFNMADGGSTSTVAPSSSGSTGFGGFSAASSGGAAESGGNTMPIAYEGPLSGLMERLAGHFGINWRFDGSTVTVTRYETRVFVVEALPGSQTVEEGMQDVQSNSSSSSSGGSSSSNAASQSSMTQNSKFKIDFQYWSELEKIINNILGGTGSAVVAPSHGTITVTTTPQVMQNIANYIDQENRRVSRQIAVTVEIYTVSLSEGLDYNVAFNTALRRLTDFGGNFNGALAPTRVSGFTGGGALSLAILNPNQISNLGNGENITHPVGEITDIFTALSGIGSTTKVAKFPMVTLNNRPVSRRIGQDVTYVASATANATGSSGSSSTAVGTSLTPGVITQGFSVQLTPRLLDDGRILLQYSLNIVDVLEINSFNSVTGTSTTSTAAGSSTIQLPKTSNRIFVQQSVLKSGSTLIIGGAEEEDAAKNSQGVGDPYNYWLGGGNSSGRSHTMIFFALTPQVLDTPQTDRG